jgi:hypothetical protein
MLGLPLVTTPKLAGLAGVECMQSSELEYWRRREMEERDAARAATSAIAQRCHEELANKYQALHSGKLLHAPDEGSPIFPFALELQVRST